MILPDSKMLNFRKNKFENDSFLFCMGFNLKLKIQKEKQNMNKKKKL